MSSELQLDVRHLNRWRRHLVNAYEVRQAWCLLQIKLCDPCLSALKWFVYHARRYTSALLFYSINAVATYKQRIYDVEARRLCNDVPSTLPQFAKSIQFQLNLDVRLRPIFNVEATEVCLLGYA